MSGLTSDSQGLASALGAGTTAPVLAQQLGSVGPQAPQEQAEPPDFSTKYNTALAPAEESQYQAWVAQMSQTQGRDMNNDLYDYDLRGAWKADAQAATNGHLPDTWKKPNHPTFSDQSQYHGQDGFTGGTWGGDDAAPTFTPGPTNLLHMGRAGLEKYFQEREPTGKLIFQP